MNDNSQMQSRATLKTIAEHVGLTPGTISAVLNNTRAADRIPQHTRDRVLAAARELNYSPNPLARALRGSKSASQQMQAGTASAVRGALVIIDSDQFERALHAIQRAGLRVPDDISIVDLFHTPSAWEHPSFASTPEYPGNTAAKAS